MILTSFDSSLQVLFQVFWTGCDPMRRFPVNSNKVSNYFHEFATSNPLSAWPWPKKTKVQFRSRWVMQHSLQRSNTIFVRSIRDKCVIHRLRPIVTTISRNNYYALAARSRCTPHQINNANDARKKSFNVHRHVLAVIVGWFSFFVILVAHLLLPQV